MLSSLVEIQMSERRDVVGRQVSLGDPSPPFLLSHGSSVPSGLITTTKSPTSSVLKRETASKPPQTSITMTNHGDDCYFFYYSNCTKGDTCPFRHCEAAMGSEIVCNLWQEGRCFRTVCKFRHMEITKNRKEICCYWENQPAGCQKPHCAFFHERPRCIDGTFVPPDKSLNKTEEQPHEEPPPAPAASLTAAANPQLRGVKTETQEPVPSPTHPPVVINPADDDEDEDDQFSEEGEDGKVGLSPWKPPKSGDSLSFGVSTLEEIRLRKALKASMKRAGYPMQSPDPQANGEKENIQSLFGATLYQAEDGPFVCEETARPRGSLAERLGRKMPNNDVKFGGVVPLRRGLSGRLGRLMDEEEPFLPPQKALKPIKDRLGLAGSAPTSTQPADTDRKPKKAPEQIRIKTLEEIRQEKAARSPSQSPSAAAAESSRSKAAAGVKRAAAAGDDSVNHTKSFSEGLCAKKKRQEGQDPKSKKRQGEPDRTQGANVGQLRVKTLEEIRREKAAKVQAQQNLEGENQKSSDSEESPAKKPHLLHVKLNSPTGSVATQKSSEVTEKRVKTPPAAPEVTRAAVPSAAPRNNVKVKTFEEIMLEKRLRKQEMQDRATDRGEAEPAEKPSDEGTARRKAPAKVRLTSPGSSSPSSTADGSFSTQKVPVGKPVSLRPKAASSLSSTTRGARAAAVKAAPSVPAKQVSPPPAESDSRSPGRSREVPDKNTRSSTAPSPATPPRGPAAEGRTPDKTLNRNQKTSPEHGAEAKVRPKLNVKPSVVKPAVQVKPGQKRRGAARSAVAAVKPLSSTSTQQEPTCRGRAEFPSASAEAQLSAAVPRSPSTPVDSGSGCSPPREDLQTVPVFKRSRSQDAVVAASASEASTVPQSPVPKTPTQAKSRRLSLAAPRTASTSAMDDFEELINEFTEDHLEGDVDPGIEEDDLLQELSEMIDS
uniref:zinc finger CCCH domain-containing protein 11A isoform X3 n=1 Tax=Gasterosteus aculeatus aculeatus TaxID=481459 RepID=UPI001A994FB3|nr:zinc finger CCCH domain-containing protein 11A isoform X3 [Gasterosteus aculeatus aculeatus]